MKKLLFLFVLLLQISYSQEITIFDNVPFYHIYRYVNITDNSIENSHELPPEAFSQLPVGAIRSHAQGRDVISRKLTSSEINSLGDNLTLNVTLFAACDNYDRIGLVSLVFVPKDWTTYSFNSSDIKRFEIARFITPFMDKNKLPNQVPFSWKINHISKILKDSALLANYDMWFELRIDGTTDIGQVQVSDCKDRNDTFRGTLKLVSSSSGNTNKYVNEIVPIANFFAFNNYTPGAYTFKNKEYVEKSFTVTLNRPLLNAKLYITTSKHGANDRGEEYIRRWHKIYLNNKLLKGYKPNETSSCEPFRVYNTQGNDIYGPTTKNNWTDWNNWCPADKIPTKEISLGYLRAGTHTLKFRLEAKDTGNNVFRFNMGDVFFSAYMHGSSTDDDVVTRKISESSNSSGEKTNENIFSFFPNPTQGEITLKSKIEIKEIELFNSLGQSVMKSSEKTLNIKNLQKGIYIANIVFIDGSSGTSKIIKE